MHNSGNQSIASPYDLPPVYISSDTCIYFSLSIIICSITYELYSIFSFLIKISVIKCDKAFFANLQFCHCRRMCRFVYCFLIFIGKCE